MGGLRAQAALVSRFGAAGLFNTAVGFAVIATLDVGLHLPPTLANLGGYVVGAPLGFVLNRSFVFRHAGAPRQTGPRYLAVVGLAFALNQAVLRTAGALLGPGALAHLAAQVAGMAAYTTASFLACRLWVFRAEGDA